MHYAHHVYHLYVIRVMQRDVLQQALLKDGIQTGIHYPIPVHLQRSYSDLGYRAGDFPCSEEIAQEVLSLPMYPELHATAQRDVAQSILARMNTRSHNFGTFIST